MYIFELSSVYLPLLLILKSTKCETNGIITRYNSMDIDTNANGNDMPASDVCGVDNTNNVIGHTWLARLRYRNDEYGCGGVLINERYVVTAASCLTGDIFKRFGQLKQVTLFENPGDGLGQDYEIEETIIHSKFTPNDIHAQNDIGLIRLAADINLHQSTPICTDGNEDLDKNYTPHVAGWGQTYTGEKTKIRQLLQVKYVNSTACHDLLSPYSYEVTSLDVCVSLNENDYDHPCPVDGGGVLIIQNKSKWWLIGIGSYNAVCGYHARPGVFTKFHKINSWIGDNVRA